MIFVLDNYDSFTYNLVHLLYALEPDIVVRRNRDVTVEEVLAMKPEAIILSPGPGRPETAGIMPELIVAAAREGIPMLGVCLGHQAIGMVFGAKVVAAKEIMHGKISLIEHDGKGLFTGIKGPFSAVRYHSLALDAATIPAEFDAGRTENNAEARGLDHSGMRRRPAGMDRRDSGSSDD